MKIGVCAKITPDMDARIKPTADGSAIDTTGVKWVVSPYDAFAVEEAIITKEKHGGEAVSFTVGGDQVPAQLRSTVLALAIDRAVVVDEAAARGTDSLGVARILAKAAEKEGVQVLFTGKVAIDDDNAQVPAMIAEILGWPQVSSVVGFSIDGDSFTATRRMDGGVLEVLRGKLPVVITADRGLNTPRNIKLPDIMKAKKKPIDTLTLADLGLSADDVAPAVKVDAYHPPPERPKGRMLTGDVDTQVKELVRLLREEAKVI